MENAFQPDFAEGFLEARLIVVRLALSSRYKGVLVMMEA